MPSFFDVCVLFKNSQLNGHWVYRQFNPWVNQARGCYALLKALGCDNTLFATCQSRASQQVLNQALWLNSQ